MSGNMPVAPKRRPRAPSTDGAASPHRRGTPERGTVDDDPVPSVALRIESVKTLLRAAGWSLADLARASDLDQSAITRLMRGDLRPGQRSIPGLMQAFNGRFPTVGFYELFEAVASTGQVIPPPVEWEEADGVKPRPAHATVRKAV